MPAVLLVLLVHLFDVMPPPPGESVTLRPGDAVEVFWDGDWYEAVLLQAEQNSFLIHYVGYRAAWDEWVGPGRIRAPLSFSEGDAVEARRRGGWYAARVTSVSNGLYKVHYLGLDAGWDEWLESAQLRPRTRESHQRQ